MNLNRKEEIIKQFVDLENFGEELFVLAAPAPSLHRKSKKRMLKTIVGSKTWNLPRIAFTASAVSFALFAFVFGFAQLTSAPTFLASLKIVKPTVQTAPTAQEIQQVQQQLTNQLEKIETLEQSGATEAEIAKAKEDLDVNLKKTESEGFKITKTTNKDGRVYIYVKPSTEWGKRSDSNKDTQEAQDPESFKDTQSEDD